MSTIIKNVNIQNKPVLTKTANLLTVFTNENSGSSMVSIGANLFYTTNPPTGSTAPVEAISVFYDNFFIPESNLPGTGSVEDKAVTYVCEIWDLTLD